VIADLDPDRARAACHKVGWDSARIARTAFVPSGVEACADPRGDVIVEATGSPPAGSAHARAAVTAGKPIVIVHIGAGVLARAGRCWPRRHERGGSSILSLMATSQR